jgi:excisionase family DNA binding protein
MSDLSVTEAAQRLRVSPRRVRALLADGRLPGRQIAGRWLLSSRDVERRQQAAPPPGRPLSPASAWHILAVLSRADDALRDLAPPARSRARARAAELRQCRPADLASRWQSALGSRARTRDFYAHPSTLNALLADPDVLRSGISAAGDHGADLMVTGSAEGYIRSLDLPQLQARFALSPDAGAHANLRLHLTQSDEGGWAFRRAAAPAAVVAADLIERETPRDRAAGVKLAARL